MDVNRSHIQGRICVSPGPETLTDGTDRLHLLVLVRDETTNRVDVIPVVVPGLLWTGEVASFGRGDRIAVWGSLRREYADGPEPGPLRIHADTVAPPGVDDGSRLR